MATAITYGIKVHVEPMYQPMYSKPMEHEYVHAYQVTIENMSEQAVQLLRRHWYIWDSMGKRREVEGPGVIGQQPIIEPNGSHQYVSACPLKSDMGKMFGTYQMKRLADEHLFFINIPVFELIPPFKSN